MQTSHQTSTADLLRTLHRRGRLLPLLNEALAEQLCVSAARDAGLVVTDDELQQAANDFRHRRGLTSADQTSAWLDRQRLSVADFETVLENDLLIQKFQAHLADREVSAHFETHRDRYARVHLRELVVGSEGLARELLQQVTEDGADFADLARRHSLAPSRDQGGDLGVVCRATLPTTLADTVFATREGDTTRPILSDAGYRIFRVEAFLSAEHDGPTRQLIGRAVFDAWLREQLANLHIDLRGLGN